MIDRVLAAMLANQRQSWEQGVAAQACGSRGFDRPGTSTEAQAFYLMVHAQLSR